MSGQVSFELQRSAKESERLIFQKRRPAMPILVKHPKRVGSPAAPPSSPASLGCRRSEAVARQLAPIIAKIREAGHHSIAGIAKCLNDRGVRAPSGGPFTYETTRRILKEVERLGLGAGPRTASAALSARHERKRTRQAAVLAELQARRQRQHPDWD